MSLTVLGNCQNRWSSRSGKEEWVQASPAITWWCFLPGRHTGSSKLFPPQSSPRVIPYHVPWVNWNSGEIVSCLILSPYPFLENLAYSVGQKNLQTTSSSAPAFSTHFTLYWLLVAWGNSIKIWHLPVILALSPSGRSYTAASGESWNMSGTGVSFPP